jgi:polyisoprenoid-binding protein YceI
MRSSHLLFAGALLVFASACDNQPAKDKSVAAVAAPAEATTAAPSGAVQYVFSDADSDLEFVGAKVTKKHDGSFEKFNGKIHLVDNDPLKSQVSVDVETDSIKTDTEKLTGHLKSADFFDTAKFPKASFTSTSIKAGGDKGASHTVTGNLDLHGVKKAITFPATIKVEGDSVEVNGEFAINRKDFAIVYAGLPDDLIKDDVLIKLKIKAKKHGGA